MSTIKQIDVHQLKDLLDAEAVSLVDIRDPQSFEDAHIPYAVSVNNQNINEQLQGIAKDRPLVVCCYHGISSLDAAAYFMREGFQDVASLIGGYEAWQQNYPPHYEVE